MEKKEFNFVGNRRKFYVFSIIILVVALVSFFTKQFELDIEFKGGSIIEVDLGQAFENNEIEDIISSVTGIVPTVQKMGQVEPQTAVSISTISITQEQQNEIMNKLAERYSVEDINQKANVRNIQPTFGQEMQSRAVTAVVLSSIAILIYIAIVFRSMSFSAGVTALIASVHDILVMLAVYSLFGIPLNSTFVAALLTIIGYSINDTVVVYDRIRENTINLRKAKVDELVNTSINQTLRRTLLTGVSVLGALVILFIFGVYFDVETIKQFSLPLIVGVVAGTYSSIFIASNLWVSWREYKTARKLKKA